MNDNCDGCGAVRIVKRGYCKRCRMDGTVLAAEASIAEASA